MEIIPVLDLMNGLAVHARQGHRESYQPLQSPLCRSAEPCAVVEGLLSLHPFKTVYIADLDALMGKGRQTGAVAELRQAFPDLGWWIDQGIPGGDGGLFFPLETNTRPVIGSESLRDEDLSSLAGMNPAEWILSLDSRAGQPLGPASLPERPDLWPDTVILMNLSVVGSGGGPSVGRLEQLTKGYPRHRFVAAGGVRDGADLARLDALGVAAVLMASALHSGAVDARVLREFG
jgi:phosphoribosylformimino-5-aminoimidazole carboxamide ribotide isomerase